MAQSFSLSRLEAFSDGVIAVIITIMVLELNIPHEDGFAGLCSIAPTMGIYVSSFTFVGIYWINHHLLLLRVRHVFPRILWANLFWLFSLSLLPFFTAYVIEKGLDRFSVALYAASLLLTAFSFMLLRLAVSARQRAEGTFVQVDRALQWKHWGSLGVYLACVPLAYLYPVLSLLIIGAVTVFWIIPTLGVGHSEEDVEAHSPGPR